VGNLQRRAPDLLAALFAVSSLCHLVAPSVFEPLIPSWLPSPRKIIHTSGLVELVCAVGLRSRTKWASSASVLLLLGIFPGNVQMAVTASRRTPGRWTTGRALALARLPLQLPLIWAALQCKHHPFGEQNSP
jgi:uncharacterized membrane protein